MRQHCWQKRLLTLRQPVRHAADPVLRASLYGSLHDPLNVIRVVPVDRRAICYRRNQWNNVTVDNLLRFTYYFELP